MSQLRDRMERSMQLRNLSDRTRQSYLTAISGLASWSQRNPATLADSDIQSYLLHLRLERQLSPATCRLTASACKFLYHQTLGLSTTDFIIPDMRVPRRLPQLPSRDQIARLIQVAQPLRNRLVVMLAYGAGLRVSEIVALRIRDIDSTEHCLRVEQGKGGVSRYTLLPDQLLHLLRRYWQAERPQDYLLPQRRHPDRHIGTGQAQKYYYRACQLAGLHELGGIHSLRHAFATHLLEGGANLHLIQRLLGHKQIGTTMVYLHLARRHLTAQTSPLDRLPNLTGAR